ncbi:hypothetical protein [Kamptonema formosum]|nr:hypothetical protein [Oscillatoria sp. PCC 10802]
MRLSAKKSGKIHREIFYSPCRSVAQFSQTGDLRNAGTRASGLNSEAA